MNVSTSNETEICPSSLIIGALHPPIIIMAYRNRLHFTSFVQFGFEAVIDAARRAARFDRTCVIGAVGFGR
jgi:hypothetical protein